MAEGLGKGGVGEGGGVGGGSEAEATSGGSLAQGGVALGDKTAVRGDCGLVAEGVMVLVSVEDGPAEGDRTGGDRGSSEEDLPSVPASGWGGDRHLIDLSSGEG